MTSTSSPTPTASHTAKLKSTNQLNTTGMWIGIGVGLAALAGLVISLLWWEQRRYNTRKRLNAMEVGTGEFMGGYKLGQEPPRNYATPPGTDYGRRNGFIGEVQSEESGKRHREAFLAWKRKAKLVKGNVEDSLDTPAQTPTEILFKSSGIERRRTYDEWKTGVVRLLSSELPQDMRESVMEEDSVGASTAGVVGLPTIVIKDSKGQDMHGENVETAIGETVLSSTSNVEALEHLGE